MRWLLPVLLATSAAACAPDDVDFAGKHCPCGPGWVCQAASNTCQRPAEGPECRALFVVQPTVESADDLVAARIEEAHDCAVTTVADDMVQVGDADEHDVILISSSSRSSEVGGLFRGTVLPVVSWEPFVFPDLGMTDVTASTHFGAAEMVTDIEIIGPSHPLAAGMNGTATIYTEPSFATWGVPAGEGGHVATVDGHPTLLFFRAGDRTVAERATGCRIGLPMHDLSAERFTDAGWAMFDAAFTWALDGCP